jgi:hypothetical protein
MNTRGRLLHHYGHLYKKHYYVDDHLCFYCGDARSGYDHCPPVEAVESFVVNKTNKLCLIGSCWPCNKMLGRNFIPRVYDRTRYIITNLALQYKLQAACPLSTWILNTSLELQEKNDIKSNKLNALLARIDYAHNRLLQPETFPPCDFE